MRYHAIHNAALDAAAGDTIQVGTSYDNTKESNVDAFPINVNTKVTITSAGATKPTIEPETQADVFSPGTNPATFKNLKIVTANDRNAIALGSNNLVTVKNCTIVQNSASGDGGTTCYALNAVSGPVTVGNTTFKGQGAYDTGAIKLGVTADGSLVENSAFQNLDDGVYAVDADKTVLNNNVLDNIRNLAVKVEANSNDGISFTMENSDLKTCGSGIKFVETANDITSATVSQNNFMNADVSAKALSGDLSANDTADTVMAENNYWNDDSGPSGAGDGAGDAIGSTISVDYNPWLVSKDGSTYDFTYALEPGMNLVSLPLIPADNSITTFTGPMENLNTVWSYDTQTGSWLNYSPGAQGNDLSAMVDGKGYWITIDSGADESVLAMNGSTQVGAGSDPRAYDVYTGWNLIGYKAASMWPSSYPTAKNYLGAVAVNVDRMYKAPSGSYTAIDTTNLSGYNMERGFGYWLAVSADGTIYP